MQIQKSIKALQLFCRQYSSTTDEPLGKLKSLLMEQMNAMRESGTFKSEQVITTPQGPHVTLGSNKSLLNFCANNYLGLSNHPKLVQAAKDALTTHGFGLSSVRFICGTQDLHKKLEAALSSFHGTEDTILYPSCFDANGGLFEAILGPEDAVISDELNHASIIDGIRLCKANRFRYKHADMGDLEIKLSDARSAGARTVLIATDGVFSMDGDIAVLDKICDLADKYGAIVFIDECHATGILGRSGRGTDELCGVQGRVAIINSTLGKALGGGMGGYTTGPKEVVSLLRQRARPYLFSNTLPPAIVGASLTALELITGDEGAAIRSRLVENTAYFRREITAAGFEIRPGTHPIVPVMIGDAALASRMGAGLLERGIYAVAFSYPVVPRGLARIRVQISAHHTREHLDTALGTFKEVGQQIGLLH